MITINTISPTRFSFNGVTYHKNFMPFVTGNKIAIINVYDGCITLTDAPTIFSDYTVNGVTYSSVNDLQSALLDVIYTRNSLTNAAITLTTTGNSGAATLTGITLNIPNYIGGTGTTNFLPKFTGLSTLGNSQLFDNGTNVGIGTTSPVLKFDVVSTSQYDGIRTYNTSSTQGADIRVGNDVNNNLGFLRVGGSALGNANANTLMVGTGGGYDIHIAPNGTPAITAKNGGNVGIGTTSPSQKLDVNGLINSTNGISVGGEGVSRFWTGTQAAYDAITTKVSTNVYLIT
jgi:hypothetical protein